MANHANDLKEDFYGLDGQTDSGRTDLLPAIDIDPSFAQFIGQGFDAGFDGNFQDPGLWEHVVPESALEESSHRPAELTDAEKAIVSIALKRFAKFGGRTPSALENSSGGGVYITAEDFEEGTIRDSFMMCYGHAYNLLGDKKALEGGKLTDSAKRALEFYFCYSPEDMTFNDAGPGMSPTIRLDVIRMRFMYEFWASWRILPAMPFAVVPLPDMVHDGAYTVADMQGVALCHAIWEHPGINVEHAIANAQLRLKRADHHATDEEVLTALNLLLGEYLVSRKYLLNPLEANLYLTGANPEQEILDMSKDPNLVRRIQRSTIWWSRLFPE